jgi:hypothetical protein
MGRSGVYDIRFKRKDLKEYDPKHYVTTNITEQDVIDLKEIFDYFDTTKSGVLLPTDLMALLS